MACIWCESEGKKGTGPVKSKAIEGNDMMMLWDGKDNGWLSYPVNRKLPENGLVVLIG
jgi:hypothetical protein